MIYLSASLQKTSLKVILLYFSFYTSASLQEFWKPSQTNYNIPVFYFLIKASQENQ